MKKEARNKKIKILAGAVIVIFALIVVINIIIMQKAGIFEKIKRNVERPLEEETVSQNNVLENSDISEIGILSVSESSDSVTDNSDVTTVAANDTDTWDLSKVDIVYDTEGVAVPVPKGYVVSGADGEHTVNTGFVIYEGDGKVTNENAWNESCTRNQFVWVPVPDVSRIYEIDANGKKKSKLYTYSATGRTSYTNSNYEPGILTSYDNEKYFARYKMQGMTRDKLLHELQEELDATIESIEKYGGFWIGRYETGALSTKEPVVQRMNTDIHSQTWYTEYTRMQLMGANANVKTSMIFGCLWDETLQWLVDTENKTYAEIADSTSWGNYNPITFEYTTTSGGTATKAASSSVRVPAGSTEYTKSNNIYDMAGNVYDWTLEGGGSSYRSLRGGYYNGTAASNMTASYRGNGVPSNSNNNYGFRACLYIR